MTAIAADENLSRWTVDSNKEFWWVPSKVCCRERESVEENTRERERERERESKRVVIECHKLRAAESLATTHDID